MVLVIYLVRPYDVGSRRGGSIEGSIVTTEIRG
jgi:hypothetical protein